MASVCGNVTGRSQADTFAALWLGVVAIVLVAAEFESDIDNGH